MKKTLALAVLLACSFSGFAQEGGFKGGEPPPQQKDAGSKGTEDTGESKIDQIRDMRKNAWVTLEGHILKKTADESYTFRDETGTLDVNIPHAVWDGKEFNADDMVRLSGYVKGTGEQTKLNVERVEKP
ncbi:NirD/YgiW/YdeI family stress tolerance protein [Erwinia sp. P6884]|uniref:YgiW/YdeI family stress tolerance OB fold protein n=1 Tax=Erwinia sp. P6884 TaxID=3141450 RepID=UPI003190CB3C